MTERTLTQVQTPERGFLRRLHDVTQVRQGRRQRGPPIQNMCPLFYVWPPDAAYIQYFI